MRKEANISMLELFALGGVGFVGLNQFSLFSSFIDEN